MKSFRCLVMTLGLLLLAGQLAAAQRWMKVSSPHFTLFTEDSLSTAKEWAACLEAYHHSLNELAATDDRLLDQMIMVIFDREKSYLRIVEPYEKQEFGRTSIYRYAYRDGRFVSGVNAEDTGSAQHGVFLQAGFWLTNSYRQPLPTWLGVGLQEVYSRYTVSGATMTVGYAEDDYVRSLKEGLRLPLAQMFAMTTHSPAYQAKAGVFNAQAWAFVHYLLLAEKGAHRAKLSRFMAAIQRGDDETEALQQAFPEGLEALSRQFSKYVRWGSYPVADISANLGLMKSRIRVEPATEAEVQMALGYLCLYVPRAAPSDPYFERLKVLAPDDPATWECLAAAAGARNDQAQMIAYYQAAVQAGSDHYIAHYYASLSAVRAMYGMEAAADRGSAEAARQAVDAVKATLRLRPNFYTGYETLAMLMGSLTAVNEDDGLALAAGMRRFPDDAELECGQLAYEIHLRRFDAAKARLKRIKSGDLANAQFAVYYAGKLEARLGAVINLKVLEQRLAKDDTDGATKVLALLNGAPLLPDEQAQLVAFRGGMAGRAMVVRAQELIAAGKMSTAGVLLDSLDPANLDETTKAKVIQLQEQVRAAK